MRKTITVKENDDGSFSFEETTFVKEKVQNREGRIGFVSIPDRLQDGSKETADGMLVEMARLLGVKLKG